MSKNQKFLNANLLFRAGLGLVFLSNSIQAWLAPAEFKDLITSNAITSRLGHATVLVKGIGVNDALLFLLLISGKWRKLVAIWAALWLIPVIILTGVWTTDFVFHLGVLLLVGYYYFSDSKS